MRPPAAAVGSVERRRGAGGRWRRARRREAGANEVVERAARHAVLGVDALQLRLRTVIRVRESRPGLRRAAASRSSLQGSPSSPLPSLLGRRSCAVSPSASCCDWVTLVPRRTHAHALEYLHGNHERPRLGDVLLQRLLLPLGRVHLPLRFVSMARGHSLLLCGCCRRTTVALACAGASLPTLRPRSFPSAQQTEPFRHCRYARPAAAPTCISARRLAATAAGCWPPAPPAAPPPPAPPPAAAPEPSSMLDMSSRKSRSACRLRACSSCKRQRRARHTAA